MLNERAREIHAFIQRYRRENGSAPTIREIGQQFGISSTNGVRYYLTMLETDQVQFATLFRLLATHPAGLFFHCRIGKDRTGLVAAMILAMVGVAYDDIVADYTLTTPRITPLVARYQA
ncbi:MAG: hypothetical protein RJA51_1714, partial [Actinomycetota bacterium]